MRKENSRFRIKSIHEELYSRGGEEKHRMSDVYWAASFLMFMINLWL